MNEVFLFEIVLGLIPIILAGLFVTVSILKPKSMTYETFPVL